MGMKMGGTTNKQTFATDKLYEIKNHLMISDICPKYGEAEEENFDDMLTEEGVSAHTYGQISKLQHE